MLTKMTPDKVNRSEWPSGRWMGEPDKAQWVDEMTGMTCLAQRNPFGAWCGYVAIPTGHPWADAPYHELDMVTVHGGLTYTGNRDALTDVDGIAVWHGFDCSHYCDFAPGMAKYGDYEHGDLEYRDFDYVKSQCAALARQAADGASCPACGDHNDDHDCAEPVDDPPPCCGGTGEGQADGHACRCGGE